MCLWRHKFVLTDIWCKTIPTWSYLLRSCWAIPSWNYFQLIHRNGEVCVRNAPKIYATDIRYQSNVLFLYSLVNFAWTCPNCLRLFSTITAWLIKSLLWFTWAMSFAYDAYEMAWDAWWDRIATVFILLLILNLKGEVALQDIRCAFRWFWCWCCYWWEW